MTSGGTMEQTPSETDFKLSTTLRIDHLTRNVNDLHLRDIFSSFGELDHFKVKMDPKVKLSNGWGLVKFKSRKDAESAFLSMNLGQIDGKQVAVKFEELSLREVAQSIGTTPKMTEKSVETETSHKRSEDKEDK